MRIFAILTIATLSAAVATETAYLVKLGRRMNVLAAEVEALRGGSGTVGARAGLADDDEPGEEALAAARRRVPRLNPQAVAAQRVEGGASDNPVVPAVLEALNLPEARQAIRGVMSEEFQRRKILNEQKKTDNVLAKFKIGQEVDRLALAAAPGLLALEPEKLQKLQELVASREAARNKAMQEVGSGAKPREQAEVEVEQLEDQVDQQVQALLGKDRWRKYNQFAKTENKRLKQEAKLARIEPAQ